MSMTPTIYADTLDSATDEELNEVFALEVCKLRKSEYHGDCGFDVYEKDRIEWVGQNGIVAYRDDRLPWTTSIDASMDYLSKHDWNAWTQGEGNTKRVYVSIYPARGEKGYAPSCAPTFEKAVVLALIRHVRAGKVGKAK